MIAPDRSLQERVRLVSAIDQTVSRNAAQLQSDGLRFLDDRGCELLQPADQQFALVNHFGRQVRVQQDK